MEYKNPRFENGTVPDLSVQLNGMVCDVINSERIFQHPFEDLAMRVFSDKYDGMPVSEVDVSVQRPAPESMLGFTAEISLNRNLYSTQYGKENFLDFITPPNPDGFTEVDGVYFERVECSDLVKVISASGSEFLISFAHDEINPKIFISNNMRIFDEKGEETYSVEPVSYSKKDESVYFSDFLTAFMQVMKATPECTYFNKNNTSIYGFPPSAYTFSPQYEPASNRYPAEDEYKPLNPLDDAEFTGYMRSLLEIEKGVPLEPKALDSVPGLRRETRAELDEILYFFAGEGSGSSIRPRGVIMHGNDPRRSRELVEAVSISIGAELLERRGNDLYSRKSYDRSKAIYDMFDEARTYYGPVALFINDLGTAISGSSTTNSGRAVMSQALASATEKKRDLIVFAHTDPERLLPQNIWDSNGFNWQIEVPTPNEAEVREIMIAKIAEMMIYDAFTANNGYLRLGENPTKTPEKILMLDIISRIAYNNGLTATEIRSVIENAEDKKQRQAKIAQANGQAMRPVRANDLNREIKILNEQKRK